MRGVYSATSIMLAGLDYQAVVAKNLANANTTGYKADRVSLSQFESLLLELNGNDSDPLGMGVGAGVAPVDLDQGPLKETGRALDIGISGSAFLAVQTPDGMRLTRDGSLGLNAQRQLVVGDGYQVLGTNGPITLPEGEVAISEDGRVFVDGQLVQALSLYVFDDPTTAQKAGENLFQATGRQAVAGEAQVLQGYLEGSNVDIADSMSKMMAVMRTYEAAQRVVLAQSQTVDTAATQVGQV
ncbi:MAG: flagellar hook-basal body protein [Anaerolineae bacterium]